MWDSMDRFASLPERSCKMDVAEGTIKKLVVTIEPIGNITLSQCDFRAIFSTYGHTPLVIDKSDAVKQSDDSYMFVVDTAKVGPGELDCQLVVWLPDADVPGMLRPEVLILNPQITIVKSKWNELLKR